MAGGGGRYAQGLLLLLLLRRRQVQSSGGAADSIVESSQSSSPDALPLLQKQTGGLTGDVVGGTNASAGRLMVLLVLQPPQSLC